MDESIIDNYQNIDRLLKITRQMSLRKNRHLIMINYLQNAKEALRQGHKHKADFFTRAAQKILFKEIPWIQECLCELVKHEL